MRHTLSFQSWQLLDCFPCLFYFSLRRLESWEGNFIKAESTFLKPSSRWCCSSTRGFVHLRVDFHNGMLINVFTNVNNCSCAISSLGCASTQRNFVASGEYSNEYSTAKINNSFILKPNDRSFIMLVIKVTVTYITGHHFPILQCALSCKPVKQTPTLPTLVSWNDPFIRSDHYLDDSIILEKIYMAMEEHCTHTTIYLQ